MGKQAGQLAGLAIEAMENGWHQPIVNKRCNALKIDDEIFQRVYSGVYPATTQDEVDTVVGLINTLIEENS